MGISVTHPLFPFITVVSQNVINKSCLVCVWGENMLADPSLDPFGPTGKVKLSYVHYNIRGSEKEVLKLTSLPQSWSQVVVCVNISGMY